MDNLLTVGEVAKLKAISIKALHYYEKLGILLPASINPHTHYRYYTLEQMATIDLILLCKAMGISLKSIKNYIKPNQPPDIARLIKDSHTLVAKKQAELLQTKKLLGGIIALQEAADTPQSTSSYKMLFPERHFITRDWCGDLLNLKTLVHAITLLYQQAKSERIQTLFNQGFYRIYTEEGMYHKAFLEIIPDTYPSPANHSLLPSHTFECIPIHCHQTTPHVLHTLIDTPYPPGTILIVQHPFITSNMPATFFNTLQRYIPQKA